MEIAKRQIRIRRLDVVGGEAGAEADGKGGSNPSAGEDGDGKGRMEEGVQIRGDDGGDASARPAGRERRADGEDGGSGDGKGADGGANDMNCEQLTSELA